MITDHRILEQSALNCIKMCRFSQSIQSFLYLCVGELNYPYTLDNGVCVYVCANAHVWCFVFIKVWLSNTFLYFGRLSVVGLTGLT